MIQFSAARPGVWEPALSGSGGGEDAKRGPPPFAPPGGVGLPKELALEARA